MAFTTAFMSFGIAMFICGMYHSSKLFLFAGIVVYLIGLLVTSIVEDRLKDRIQVLEDKLKET